MKPSDKLKQIADISPHKGGLVLIGQEDFDRMCDELDATAQPSPSKPFIPEDGREYWVWGVGNTAEVRFDNDEYGQMQLKIGNVHRTKEEAEAYGAWLQSPVTQARRRLEMLHGYDLCGPSFVFYDYVDNELIRWRSTDTNYGGVGFKTAEQRDYAMKHHEADLMMVLMGEV